MSFEQLLCTWFILVDLRYIPKLLFSGEIGCSQEVWDGHLENRFKTWPFYRYGDFFEFFRIWLNLKFAALPFEDFAILFDPFKAILFGFIRLVSV